jgi:hypothetical protein
MIALCAMAAASGLQADSKKLLDATDHALLARLGDNVLGKPIPPIDPAALVRAAMRSSPSQFLMIDGPDKGQHVSVSMHDDVTLPTGEKPIAGQVWSLDVPQVMRQYIIKDKGGLRAPLIVLKPGDYGMSYNPPEPMLLVEVAEGDSKSFEMDVRVLPVKDSTETKYQGRIRTTYTNKGSYRMTTPAGAFDGMVVRCDYQGKVGPATMNDSDLRIYSPEVGLLAIVTHNRLHAMLLVNRDKHIALLLAKDPRVPGDD